MSEQPKTPLPWDHPDADPAGDIEKVIRHYKETNAVSDSTGPHLHWGVPPKFSVQPFQGAITSAEIKNPYSIDVEKLRKALADVKSSVQMPEVSTDRGNIEFKTEMTEQEKAEDQLAFLNERLTILEERLDDIEDFTKMASKAAMAALFNSHGVPPEHMKELLEALGDKFGDQSMDDVRLQSFAQQAEDVVTEWRKNRQQQ